MKKKKIIAFLIFYVVVIAGILVMYFFIQDRDKKNNIKPGFRTSSFERNPYRLYFND